MYLTNMLRGAHMGNLGVFVRGQIAYKVSPYQLKAFGNISTLLKRTFRRTTEEAIFIVPPFALGYLVHEALERRFVQLCRKNPKDYENDK